MHPMWKEKLMHYTPLTLQDIKFKASFASGANGNLSFASPMVKTEHEDGSSCIGMDPKIVLELVDRVEELESLMVKMYTSLQNENKGFQAYADKYYGKK